MKVIYKNLPSKKKACVATIGVFDGIHRGHQFILKKLKEEARRFELPALLITFDTLPRLILAKHFPGCLTDLADKQAILKSLDLDYLWLLQTRPSLLRLSGEEFITFILNHFSVRKIVVGEDFRFGWRRERDINCLRKFARQYDFEVAVLKKKTAGGRIVSSSLIRGLVQNGDFKTAKKLLGRSYSLKGEVCRGRRLGRKLGFPTANIHTSTYVIPASGVYAAAIPLGRNFYAAAINIGTKPTVSRSGQKTLEAHIIGFRRYLLGRTIKVIFLEKIREEKKFPSLEELKAAIARDIRYITKKFSVNKEGI